MRHRQTSFRRRGSAKVVLIVVGVCAVLFTLMVGGVFVGVVRAAAADAARDQALLQVAAPMAAIAQGHDPGLPNPSISGKVVIIDDEATYVDTTAGFHLPPDLVATTPEEIGTVAVCRWDWVEVGTYHDEWGARSGTGYQCTAEVALIDVATRSIIARTRLVGPMPREAVRGDGDHRGLRPYEQLAEWIQSLPRR